MDRIKKALNSIDLSGRGLEIGPSYSPIVPKSSGARVETVDHADRETLRAKFGPWGVPQEQLDRIEPVDHLWSGGSLLDVIPDKGCYDYIVASHFIEHTVDLIRFLNDCEALLAARGRLSLVVPDKRYCFDRFQPLSTVGDVIDAHVNPGKYHPAGALLDHQAYACKRADGAIAWGSEGDSALVVQFPRLEGATEAISNGIAQDTYHDTHRWKFTPTSFDLLLSDLATLGYHGLGVVDSWGTTEFEFFRTLESGTPQRELDRIGALLKIEEELVSVGQATPSPRNEHDVLRGANRDLERMIAELRSSTSWRVTAPLRAASKGLRHLRSGATRTQPSPPDGGQRHE